MLESVRIKTLIITIIVIHIIVIIIISITMLFSVVRSNVGWDTDQWFSKSYRLKFLDLKI